MLLSFILCLTGFLMIGTLSLVKNRHSTSDYLVASYNTSPLVVALSAVATNNSGYMFIGMIGYTVSVGLASIWLMIGWILGDFFTSLFVHKRLRQTAEKYKLVSYPSVLAQLIGSKGRVIPALAATITLVFLSTYAAAQLSAGGKSLHVLFTWDPALGSVIGAIIVVAYCFVGGIRASFWTDVAQSVVMIAAMFSLCIGGLQYLGGWTAFLQSLYGLEQSYLYFFPTSLDSPLSILSFLLGWLVAGIAVVGQPHIMLRFLALDSPKHMTRVRIYYYSFYTIFYILTICVGILARLILGEAISADPELALPKLSLLLFPPYAVGLVIAGLFAATMSTADSQIMACAASLSHDFSKTRPSYYFVKLSTLMITAVALAIAIWGNQSVFRLVLFSWSAMGSAFAPLIILASIGRSPTARVGGGMMLAGLCGVAIGHVVSPQIYEILPGMLCSFTVYLVAQTGRLIRFKLHS